MASKRKVKSKYWCPLCKWEGKKSELRKGRICPSCDDKGFKVKTEKYTEE